MYFLLPVSNLAGLSQQGLSTDDCKQTLERLRQSNACRKGASLTQEHEDHGRKRRKYTKKAPKIARDGKSSVLTIHRKMQLLKVLRFFQSMYILYIYSYCSNIASSEYSYFLKLYIYILVGERVQIEYEFGP